jgi:hypothetical protein
MSEKPISPLRRRMIEDMTVRNFVEKTRNDYIRHIRTFTTFLGRAPDMAAPEDPRLSSCIRRRPACVRPGNRRADRASPDGSHFFSMQSHVMRNLLQVDFLGLILINADGIVAIAAAVLIVIGVLVASRLGNGR